MICYKMFMGYSFIVIFMNLILELQMVVFFLNTLLVGDFPGGSGTKTPISSAGGPGSISGQGTRALMLQLRI